MSKFTAGYFSIEACNIREFKQICEQDLDPALCPFATNIYSNIPVYDMSRIEIRANKPILMQEWARNLATGSGSIIIKNSFGDIGVIDEASFIFQHIIQKQRMSRSAQGDHFATAGANDRIWNSLEKLCHISPDIFIQYFCNITLNAVAEAWLGPGYQMTAQINVIHPGGKAQSPHRDYHLGFMEKSEALKYPAHVHHMSSALTLQAGISHTDMTISCGPTKLLPFSQLYPAGYLAWRERDFIDYFEKNFVQYVLDKGDMLFFNPALFHAAGENISPDISRMVNLLQISSPFGRAMEIIDRQKICLDLYPALLNSSLNQDEMDSVIAASAEGYPFPANLDKTQPGATLKPQSQAEIIKAALSSKKSFEEFKNLLLI